MVTNILALLPATSGGVENNVLDTTVSTTTANIFDIKIDHIFSDKHRISGGFDYDNTNTGGTSDLGPLFGSTTPQNTRYARISDNYIFTPSLVNQFLFGFSRRFRAELSNSIGQDFPAKIGLTGVQPTTFPCVKFTSTPYEGLLNNCGDSEFADNVYQLNDSVSWVKGKHNMKFGGEVRMLQFNVRRLTQASGEFDFNAQETSLNGARRGPGGQRALWLGEYLDLELRRLQRSSLQKYFLLRAGHLQAAPAPDHQLRLALRLRPACQRSIRSLFRG